MGDMKGMPMTGEHKNDPMAGMDMSSHEKAASESRPVEQDAAVHHHAAMHDMDMNDMPGMDMGDMDMPGMSMHHAMAHEDSQKRQDRVSAMAPPETRPVPLKTGVEVQSLAPQPHNRLGEAGDGLDGNGRRCLRYTDLRALKRGTDPREPSREIVLHLTGNMERFIWGFNGKKFSEAEPISLAVGERVRFVMIDRLYFPQAVLARSACRPSAPPDAAGH